MVNSVTPRIAPQLNRGSLEKALEAPVSNRNQRSGRTSGCRWNLRPSTKIFRIQTRNAARMAVTAPFVARGAHNTKAARQMKRELSSQPIAILVAEQLLGSLTFPAGEHSAGSPIRWLACGRSAIVSLCIL